MLITRTSLCTIHKVRRWQLVVSGILKKIMNRVGKVVPKRGNQRLHILPIVNPPFKFYEGVIFSPSASLFFARNKNWTISILGIKNQSVHCICFKFNKKNSLKNAASAYLFICFSNFQVYILSNFTGYPCRKEWFPITE